MADPGSAPYPPAAGGRGPRAALVYGLVVAATGVAAGLGGAGLTLLLHAIQHLAYGYTDETFLIGVQHASGGRRVLAMTVGGAVSGVGWWALRRFTQTTTSVTAAVANPATRLRVGTNTADAVLQILAVGFGASLGREGAPRKIGAAAAGWLARTARLNLTQQRRLLACGAGAGLAAVYNVPLGGALFTLEVLLVSAAPRDVLAAVVTSTLATVVAWPVVTNQPTYLVAGLAHLQIAPTLLVWSVLVGPVAGLAGVAFLRLTGWARSHTPTGWRLPVATTVVFAAVGAAAISYPQLLGNGKGPAQLALDGSLVLPTVGVLLLLKPIATAVCLRSGAVGGLLTPAVATGALLGALAGGLWSAAWPGSPTDVFATIGAAAVLATTQNAPLTAIVLMLEFTDAGPQLLVPMMLAVAGATAVGQRLRRPG